MILRTISKITQGFDQGFLHMSSRKETEKKKKKKEKQRICFVKGEGKATPDSKISFSKTFVEFRCDPDDSWVNKIIIYNSNFLLVFGHCRFAENEKEMKKWQNRAMYIFLRITWDSLFEFSSIKILICWSLIQWTCGHIQEIRRVCPSSNSSFVSVPFSCSYSFQTSYPITLILGK